MAKSPYDRHWRKRRAEQLRLHPLCSVCIRMGAVAVATVADHVVPHRGDPELFKGRLQSMCKAHHDGWKKDLEKTGRIRGCDLTGRPLDPKHPWNREPNR